MKKKFKLLFVSGVLLLCGVAAFVVFERIRGQKAVRRIMAESVAAGAELDVRKLIPAKPQEEENAGVELRRIGSQLPEMRETPPLMRSAIPGKVKRVLRAEAWTNAPGMSGAGDGRNSWEGLSKRVAEEREELNEVHLALRRGFYWSGFNYERGFHDFEMPGLTETLKVSRWLVADCLVHAKAGRKEESFRALESLTRLVSLMRHERLIIAQLVRRGAALNATGLLWQTLAEGMWNEEQLTTLQEIWAQNEYRIEMFRAMEMERAMSVDHWRMQRKSDELVRKAIELSRPMEEFAPEGQIRLNSWWVKIVALPVWKLAWNYHDEFNGMRLWNSRVEDAQMAVKLPWTEMKDKTGDVETMNWQYTEAGEMGRYDQSRFLFSARSIFSSTITLRNAYEADALKEMAITALGIERYRLKNGRVPESLRDLGEYGGGPRIDPMDGTPLKYKRSGDDPFVLYSAGRNGLDDGGNAEKFEEATEGVLGGKDLVWPTAAE